MDGFAPLTQCQPFSVAACPRRLYYAPPCCYRHPDDVKVFICYRRGDTQLMAVHMAQVLGDLPAIRTVYLDIDNIAIGEDFERSIADQIATASHVFVLIGERWLESRDGTGQARLFDPADVVAHELRLALAGSARLVPILVEGASMPRAAELPEDLQSLSKINAFVLRTAQFRADLDTLLDLLLGRRVGRGSRRRLAPLGPAQIVARGFGGVVGGALLLVGLGLLNRWFSEDCYDLTCRLRRSARLASDEDAQALLLTGVVLVLLLGALVPFLPRLLKRRR